jgi:hypothetical protein
MSRGQLTVVDADELPPRFMRDAMPDSTIFLGLAGDLIRPQTRLRNRPGRHRVAARVDFSLVTTVVGQVRQLRAEKYAGPVDDMVESQERMSR